MARHKATTRRRSDSQDSFAQDLDNQEDRLMAKSEQFAVPLSELGMDSSPPRDSSNATSGASNTRTGRPLMRNSPPRGRVLVEATPSHSGGSMSPDGRRLSQQLEETQIIDDSLGNDSMAVDRDGSGSGYESSEPSSSYRRFLDGERDPDPDLQATQPSTQVEEPIIPSDDIFPWSNMRSKTSSKPPSGSPFIVPGLGGPSRPSVPVSSAAATGHSEDRSLLSMINPAARARYRDYLPIKQTPPGLVAHMQQGQQVQVQQMQVHQGQQVQRAPPVPSAQTSELVETQPSLDVEPSLPLRSLPPARGAPNGRATAAAPKLPSRAPSPVPDSMDIVPDSEPMGQQDTGRATASPLKQTRPVTTPADKSRKVDDSDTEMDVDDAGDKVIAQPMEEEEEEEEVPLAAALAKPKGKAGKRPANKGKAVAAMAPPSKPATKVRSFTQTLDAFFPYAFMHRANQLRLRARTRNL